MDELELLSRLAQIGGLSFLSLGITAIIFRKLLAQKLFPKLTREHSFRLLRLITIFTFILGVVGLLLSKVPNTGSSDDASGESDSLDTPTFAIIGCSDSALASLVEEQTRLKSDVPTRAGHQVEIGHSGTFLQGSLYNRALFTGGFLVVRVDGTLCDTLRGARVESFMTNPGNYKDLLEAEIQRQLELIVKANRIQLVQIISRCLNDE
jgi:hypothetical protein